MNPNIQQNQDPVERITEMRLVEVDAAVSDVDAAVRLQEQEEQPLAPVINLDDYRAAKAVEQRPVFTSEAPVDNLATLRAKALEQARNANEILGNGFDDQKIA